MRAVLAAAIAALAPRDRLRLACYYAQEMTLAEIGTITREHEATVSRALAKTRKAVREDVERRLRDDRGFSKAEIDECFRVDCRRRRQPRPRVTWLDEPSPQEIRGQSFYE